MTANTSLLALEARRRPKSVGGGSRRLFLFEWAGELRADEGGNDDLAWGAYPGQADASPMAAERGLLQKRPISRFRGCWYMCRRGRRRYKRHDPIVGPAPRRPGVAEGWQAFVSDFRFLQETERSTPTGLARAKFRTKPGRRRYKERTAVVAVGFQPAYCAPGVATSSEGAD